MYSPTSPHVPPEVVDMIIDHLHAEKKSLMACSLVHSSWLHVARFHLLSNVAIVIDAQQLNRESGRSKEPLYHLIDSPYSTIAPYIRRIRLAGTCDRLIGQRSSAFDQAISRLRTFNGIQTLELEDIAWDLTSPASRASILDSFPQLKTLAISRMYFHSIGDLLSIIGSFPNLQSFTVGKGIRVVDRSIPPSNTTLSNLSLTELSLDETCKTDILNLFLAQTRIMPINVLQFRSITSFQRPSLDQLLTRSAPFLEHLTLDFGRPGQVESAHGIDLSQLQELRTITFETLLMYTEFSADDTRKVAGEVIDILSTVDSPHLETVVLHLWLLNSVDELDTFDWLALERLLNSPKFSSVRMVMFKMYGVSRYHSPRPDDWIRQRLSGFSSRGLLAFDGLNCSRR